VCHKFTTLNLIAGHDIVTVSHIFSVGKMQVVNQIITVNSVGLVTDLRTRSHISLGKPYFIGDTNSNSRPCKYSYDLSVARPRQSTVCNKFAILNNVTDCDIVTVSHIFLFAKVYIIYQMLTENSIEIVTDLKTKSYISMKNLIQLVPPIVTVGHVNAVTICRYLALIYLNCAISSQL
jgi:hypothetical protein